MVQNRLPEVIRLPVLDHREVAEGHWELVLPLEGGLADVVPGQFVNVLCRDIAAYDPLLRRPFSVYWANGDRFGVMYRVVGRGTRLLSRLRAGDTVDLVGPLGRGFDWLPFKDRQGGRLVLVGGGVGVPPIYFLSERLKADGLSHTALVGFAGAKQIVAVDRWRSGGVEPGIATVDGSVGHPGFVTDLLQAALEQRDFGAPVMGVFACGPAAMLAAVSEICKRHEVPCQVALEEWMGCGLGVCLSCVCKVQGETGEPEWARVCREGPVFDGAKVVWGG